VRNIRTLESKMCWSNSSRAWCQCDHWCNIDVITSLCRITHTSCDVW